MAYKICNCVVCSGLVAGVFLWLTWDVFLEFELPCSSQQPVHSSVFFGVLVGTCSTSILKCWISAAVRDAMWG